MEYYYDCIELNTSAQVLIQVIGKQFVKYQYDAILYHENRTCSTCEIQK